MTRLQNMGGSAKVTASQSRQRFIIFFKTKQLLVAYLKTQYDYI